MADRLQLLPQPALSQVPGRGSANMAGRAGSRLAAAEVADIAFQNKAAVYDVLFKAASETMLIIAADPTHLGARIGITAVLHTVPKTLRRGATQRPVRIHSGAS